jgi:hypothetical protein
MKRKYVRIPIIPDNTNNDALLPNLSIKMPMTGITKLEIKKGNAIATPTSCSAAGVAWLLYL